MAKNAFCEVTVTFDQQIQFILESKWTLALQAFLRYHVNGNGTDMRSK